MEAFILALVYSLPSPLRSIARPVADRLLSVWRWSEGLARRLKTGWARMVGGALRLRDGLRKLASETVTTLTWLILVRIPQTVNGMRDAVIRWATARILEARAAATALVDSLRRWVVDRVRDALVLIDGLRRWAVERIAEMIRSVQWLVRHVGGVLSTPEKAATWLVGAMWTALWRYGWSQSDRLAEAFWRRRMAISVRTIAEVERIIGRLL